MSRRVTKPKLFDEAIHFRARSGIGGDVPVQSISRAHCREVLNVLRHLPSNAGKRFPKLSAREASEQAQVRGDIKVISAANANSLISNMSSFLNWAVNEELIGRNPARGLRLHDPVARRDKRLPFSREQLHAIFSAPLYRGCVDGARAEGLLDLAANEVVDWRSAGSLVRSSKASPDTFG